MLLDALQEFSDAQAVTATGTAVSTKVLDLLKAGDAIDPLELVVQVAETVTSAGAATVQFKLETADEEAGPYTTLYLSAAVPKADLVAGEYVLKVPLPVGVRRYLRMGYVVAVAALTAGKFSSFLVPSTQREMPV